MCNTAHQIQSAEQSLNLDTIEITSEITAHTIKNTYTKRAERKAFTQEQMLHLIALNSPLEQKYRDTLQCADRVVECEEIHTGEIKYQTMFCQKRWCAVCNNRRTSHLLKAYTPALDALTDPQLVTLTIPAVPITYKHITEAVDLMFYNFSRAKDRMRKRGYTLSGIRKLESNYNTIAKTANPHFHLIVEGAEEAEILQKYWLEYYPVPSKMLKISHQQQREHCSRYSNTKPSKCAKQECLWQSTWILSTKHSRAGEHCNHSVVSEKYL